MVLGLACSRWSLTSTKEPNIIKIKYLILENRRINLRDYAKDNVTNILCLKLIPIRLIQNSSIFIVVLQVFLAKKTSKVIDKEQ